ncbi:DNA polymerase Y family protein [Terrimonas sp. NA20]|uniref:DNA polymerase Y family protein n=1 Tax=Terrimonas ginsenosidimutans TaxID=2908004 RepID=A0ABS9KKW4_9BACT|nr:DNA polymerase Y family protein [Terrimonas ginsenosidimutans]
MNKRYISIWFRFLKTDWFAKQRNSPADSPFVLVTQDHGRKIICACNNVALQQGIDIGMVLADARAIYPSLFVEDDIPDLSSRLLNKLAEWSIRFSPCVSADLPDGLIIDASGCAHLWGTEQLYLNDIISGLNKLGYQTRAAMADTVGAAWAVTRFGTNGSVIDNGAQLSALLSLPPQALRLEKEQADLLHKLGLRRIAQFINIPRPALRRRFGKTLLQRIDQATGSEEEFIVSIIPIEAYQERLPCLEPISTATGIEIALEKLLDVLCSRLQKEQKGLREASFKGYRIDGKTVSISIGTHRASSNPKHLFKLFALNIDSIEPDLGIEVFLIEAKKIEDAPAYQEQIWTTSCGLENIQLAELIDRIAGRIGENRIYRFLPDEHYWPERSIKKALSINEKPSTQWRTDRPRPTILLSNPELIDVTAPIPDYPPMLFRYKGVLHKIKRADGPERIEQEWWLQQGQHRDYYYVEDEEGRRYWIFRLGHYDADKTYQWFIHGFFA